MQITLHLREEDGDIHCQFGLASPHWGVIAGWFQRGCRDLVVSDGPQSEGRGQHLSRDGSDPCVFWTEAGVHQLLLPIDGHPVLNGFNELWIWPLVPFPGQRLSSPATHTASAVLVA